MTMLAEKRQLVVEMPRGQAKKIFAEVWAKENPEGNFQKTFPKSTWKWFDLWYSIRKQNHTFSLTVQAFAEKITSANRHIKELEDVIVSQRKELKKRLAELETLKSGKNEAV